MTLTLITSLINLCLIFAVWRLSRSEIRRNVDSLSFKWIVFSQLQKRSDHYHKLLDRFGKRAERELRGKMDQVIINSQVAEKMADRAFNMASSANLGVVALQKALVVPRLMTKQQATANQLAKDKVDELFSQNGTHEWLRPILSDEELEILDKAEELKVRTEMGNQQ